jgi:small subunit ribosomal protein S17
MSEVQKVPRTKTGRVVSDKMNKTITVLVERRVKHPIYGKYLTKSSKLKAHDEGNECKVGDLVTIKETRPLSKSKTWAVVKIEEQTIIV